MSGIQVWNTGGMVLRVENQTTQRKTCPSATLSTSSQGLNMGLHGEGYTPICLSHEDSQRKNTTLLSVIPKGQ